MFRWLFQKNKHEVRCCLWKNMNLLFKKAVEKIDLFFCSYLGLKEAYTKPEEIENISGNIFVKSTEPNKRHLHKNSFDDVYISQYSKEDKEKLGLAIGKSIATNLIVKFVDTDY